MGRSSRARTTTSSEEEDEDQDKGVRGRKGGQDKVSRGSASRSSRSQSWISRGSRGGSPRAGMSREEQESGKIPRPDRNIRGRGWPHAPDWNIRGKTRRPQAPRLGRKRKEGKKPRTGASGAEKSRQKAAPWTGTSRGWRLGTTGAEHGGKKAAPRSGASGEEGVQPRTGASGAEEEGGASHEEHKTSKINKNTTPGNGGASGASQEGGANKVPAPGLNHPGTIAGAGAVGAEQQQQHVKRGTKTRTRE